MRYLTSGESHGPQLTTIIEGLPAGLPLLDADINEELARRQKGHGRGRRMQIEKDTAQIVGGIRHGYTLGSPVGLVVENNDWKHWTKIMGQEPIAPAATLTVVSLADERSRTFRISLCPYFSAPFKSACPGRGRVIFLLISSSSSGAVAKKLLKELGIEVASHVIEIGGVKSAVKEYESLEKLKEITESSPVRCLDPVAEKKMMDAIDEAKQQGDSIGGIVEVIVEGMPAGVGSYVHYDRKLDAKLASGIMSINAFKGVEIGIGFEAASKPGSEVHDEIAWDEEVGYYRKTNRLGGLEGGMTTGMPIVVRGVMKPIPTLYKPLQSVDIETKEAFSASIERSDSCAVPAAAVVAESVIAWELAAAIVDQFYSDRMETLKETVDRQRAFAREF